MAFGQPLNHPPTSFVAGNLTVIDVASKCTKDAACVAFNLFRNNLVRLGPTDKVMGGPQKEGGKMRRPPRERGAVEVRGWADGWG